MVKRISKAAMLVVVLTLALALPVMAYFGGTISQCPEAYATRTESLSRYPYLSHVHTVGGRTVNGINVPSIGFRVNWTRADYGSWSTNVEAQVYGTAYCRFTGLEV